MLAWQGTPSSRATTTTSCYRQIGEAIAQLHTLTFPDFGELSPDLVVEEGTPLTEALLNRATRRIPNRAQAELFTSLLNDRVALFSATTQPRLCHEDLHGHN